MSTSHSRLPPPAAMALPVPSPAANLGQLPDRWQHGTDETQRTWLQAKSEEERRRQEEERRRQEEERTRQENFRLEIRRTELEMLREAFRGGVPPHLVPVIFTGGGALAGTSAEWATHYIAQLNQNQQQLLQGSMVSPPDSRMESRLLTAAEHQTPQSTTISTISRTPVHPPNQTPGSQHPTPGQSHGISHPASGIPAGYSPFTIPGMSPARHPNQQIHQTEPPRSSLPRINTNEMQVQQPPPPGPPPGLNMQLSGVPQQPPPPVQHLTPHHTPQQGHHTGQPPPEPPRQTESSPIFFHHWQPPSTQASNTVHPPSSSPASGKNAESPYAHQNYLSGNDASHSPKKRKTVGGGSHPVNHSSTSGTGPSHQANSFSPSFSPGSSANANKKRGVATTHNRNRSDSGSTRGYEPYAKSAAARPRRSETGSNFNDNNGSTSQFSISHMTTQDEPSDSIHREAPHKSHNGAQESQSSHQHYPAGSEVRRDHQIHKERENSVSHSLPPRS